MNNLHSYDEHIEYLYLQLIDYLVDDVKQLELEIIRLRLELSKYLPENDGILLKGEIYSDLAGRYGWQEAYRRYIDLYCDSEDPLDNELYSEQMDQMARFGYIVD